MGLQEDLNRLGRDTRFKGLSFEEQQQLRAQIVGTQLQSDPRFQSLQLSETGQLISQLAVLPPADDGISDEMSQQLSELGERAMGGDQDALKQMSNFLIRRSVYTRSIVANLLDEKLISPLMAGPLESVEELKNTDIVNLASIPESKVADYFSTIVSQDRKISNRTKTWSLIAGLGAQFAEIAAMYAVGVGFTPAGAVGLGKLFTWPLVRAATVMKMGPMALRMTNIGVNISHAAAGGVLGVAREFTLDALEGIEKNPSWQSITSRTKQYFGEYFLGDMIANISLGILFPMMRGFVKNFKGWGDYKTILKNLPVDDLSKLINKIAKMEDINPAMLSALGQEVTDNVTSAQNAFKALDRIGHMSDPANMTEDLMRVVTTSYGYGMSQAGGKYLIWNLLDSKVVKTLDDLDAVKNFLNTDIVKNMNRKATNLLDAQAKGAGHDRLRIRSIVNQRAPLGQKKNVDFLVNILAPREGRFTADRLRDFARGYLGSMDGGGKLIRSVEVKDVVRSGRKYFELHANGQKLGEVSEIVASGGIEIQSVSKILNGLNELAEKLDLQGVRTLVSEEYLDIVGRHNLYTEGWLQKTAVETIGANFIRQGQDYVISVAGKGQLTFPNRKAMGDFLMAKNTSVDEMIQHLAQTEGLTLKQLDDGVKVLDAGGREVWSGADVEELLFQHPEFIPKADPSLGPTVGIVMDKRGGVTMELTYVEGAVLGPFEEVMNHLSEFKNPIAAEKIKLSSKGATASFDTKVGRTRKFELDLPEFNYRSSFETLEEARKFVEEAPTTFRHLEDIAHSKGYQLDMYNGDFWVFGEGGQAFRAETIDDLQAIFKKVNPPEWAPELTGMPGDIVQEDMGGPNVWKVDPIQARKLRFLPKFRESLSDLMSFTKATESVFEYAVRFGGSDDMLKSFREIEAGIRLVNGRQQTIGRAVATAASDKGGILEHDTLVKIGKLMQTEPEKWVDTASKLGLGEKEMDVARNLRKIMGESAEEGLGRQFDIAPYKWLDEYLPRMRKWIQENPTLLEGKESAEIIKAMYGDSPPGELLAFFKHNRLKEDLIEVVMEENPVKIILKYAQLGNRDLFIGDAYKRALGVLKDASTKGGNLQQIHRFDNYLKDIMGVATPGEETLRRFSRNFMKDVFGVSKPQAKGLQEYLMLMGYSSLMGFRPWLPIRNMHQIWTTLSPLVGNVHTRRGLQRVLKDTDGKLFNTLRRNGVITSNPAVFGGDTLFNEGGMLAKVAEKGLRWYTNSDDFTRAVAWAAADDKFQDAMGAYKKFRLTEKEFASRAGLHFFDHTTQNRILNLAQKGDWNGSRTLYNTLVVERAMFPYRAGMSPFRGVVGKVFGQFGHYPLYYVDNIRKMMLNAPMSERLAFGATMAANSALIYGAWRAVGVDAKNFIPWNPMFFAGGPLWTMAQNALNAPSALWGNYKGRQAMAELFGSSTRDGKVVWTPGKSESFKFLVPGSLAMKGFGRAMKALGDGDYAGFTLHLMSAPASQNN